jgi:hypothetical protein
VTNPVSLFLFCLGNFFPLWLLSNTSTFPHHRSGWNPSFTSTTFQKFRDIYDLLSQVMSLEKASHICLCFRKRLSIKSKNVTVVPFSLHTAVHEYTKLKSLGSIPCLKFEWEIFRIKFGGILRQLLLSVCWTEQCCSEEAGRNCFIIRGALWLLLSCDSSGYGRQTALADYEYCCRLTHSWFSIPLSRDAGRTFIFDEKRSSVEQLCRKLICFFFFFPLVFITVFTFT